MNITVDEKNATWISVFMRVAIIIFLGFSGLRKVTGGVGVSVERMRQLFADTGTPAWLVTGQAWIVPYLEVAIAIWLLTGYKLRGAFITSALLILNFCGAMKILGNGDVVANNSLFVLLCCVGLFFCHRDRWSIDGLIARKQS
ncbi:MAG: hypothetical protein RRC34_02440 [Lentisphaeria bacterium]|nr:hypothetical protein [Lentisphaeria bacterium]